MQIKMQLPLAGPGLFLARGKEYDLPTARAVELIQAKFAVPVATSPAAKREKATRTPLETR